MGKIDKIEKEFKDRALLKMTIAQTAEKLQESYGPPARVRACWNDAVKLIENEIANIDQNKNRTWTILSRDLAYIYLKSGKRFFASTFAQSVLDDKRVTDNFEILRLNQLVQLEYPSGDTVAVLGSKMEENQIVELTRLIIIDLQENENIKNHYYWFHGILHLISHACGTHIYECPKHCAWAPDIKTASIYTHAYKELNIHKKYREDKAPQSTLRLDDDLCDAIILDIAKKIPKDNNREKENIWAKNTVKTIAHFCGVHNQDCKENCREGS